MCNVTDSLRKMNTSICQVYISSHQTLYIDSYPNSGALQERMLPLHVAVCDLSLVLINED